MIDHLAAALRRAAGAPDLLARAPVADVIAEAERHGVLPLLAERLSGEPGVPPELGGELGARLRRHAAADVMRERELAAVVAAFVAAGVPFLLVKGAQLGHLVYERPDQRPRVDADLLVPEPARANADRVLQALGYDAEPPGGGDLILYQAMYTLRHDGVLRHVVDLHWRLANPQAFGHVLSWDALAADARPVPGLDGARGPSPIDALLIACVHQVAHHPAGLRLIWLEDVRRLAARMTTHEWEAFAVRAEAGKVGAVCGHVLSQAVDLLDARVPQATLADPRLAPARAAAEPSAAWLDPGRGRAQVVAEDFALMPTWSARSRLAAQYLFPSKTYMREVYAPGSGWPLPVLYARRACRGAWRWIRGA